MPQPLHLYDLPPRFSDLKKEVLSGGAAVVEAWEEVLAELKTATSEFERVGSEVSVLYVLLWCCAKGHPSALQLIIYIRSFLRSNSKISTASERLR